MAQDIPISEEEIKDRWWLEHEYIRYHSPMFWRADPDDPRNDKAALVMTTIVDPGPRIGDLELGIDAADFNCITVLWDSDNKDTELTVLSGTMDSLVEELIELPEMRDLSEQEHAALLLQWAGHLEMQAQKLRDHREKVLRGEGGQEEDYVPSTP